MATAPRAEAAGKAPGKPEPAGSPGRPAAGPTSPGLGSAAGAGAGKPRARRPGLLVVLDGFAWGDERHPCNGVARAHTPTFDRLRRECPWTEVKNNGPDVGLPPGQMGNSEVGHLNIGAGRIVYQDYMRINNAIAQGTYGDNTALQAAFAHARRSAATASGEASGGAGASAATGRIHLIGLLGPGGVHAHESHFAAALDACAAAGFAPGDVLVHPVADGRDTPPRSAAGYLQTLQGQVEAAGVGRIVDLVGRYYAMDRDNRWERIEAAYLLYTEGKGRFAKDPTDALDQAYAAGEGDEFVKPTSIHPDGAVRSGDSVVWLNFRPDRSRQMTRAFMDPQFTGFRRVQRENVVWVCTTQYDAAFASWPRVQVAWPPQTVEMCLAEHVSKLGLTQFHIAETEKYAHVTYFLNGGREAPFDGEERVLVPSPKVATYDLRPEMAAGEVTDRILLALGSDGYDLVVVNYANPDMVGHTGKLDATIKAVEFVDNCLNRLTRVATELGFVTLITSDHGNAEEMCKLTADGKPGEPITKHTMYPSPVIVVGGPPGLRLQPGGRLENVSPTLLELMGLPIPVEMTAKSLVWHE